MTRRCARIVAFAAALGFPVAGAFADEEEDTQAPAVSPTPMTAFGAAGSDVSGARAIARDLLDEPDGVRATARWFIPVPGKAWTGGHAADLSSSREGWLRAWTRSTDGKSIGLLARADRRPLAFRTRVPFAASTLEEAETHRESARLLFSAPIPSYDGRVQVFAEWRGGGGVRPSTSAPYALGDVGSAFRAPAWR